MWQHTAMDQYRQSHIMTASPEKLVLLALNGVLRFMKGALAAHGRQDWIAFTQQMNRSEDLLLELLSALDVERGGELAENLAAIYAFVIRQLLLANLKRDAHLVEQLIPVINNIKEAWEVLCQPAAATAEPVAR